jgi:hypothetical protein
MGDWDEVSCCLLFVPLLLPFFPLIGINAPNHIWQYGSIQTNFRLVISADICHIFVIGQEMDFLFQI